MPTGKVDVSFDAAILLSNTGWMELSPERSSPIYLFPQYDDLFTEEDFDFKSKRLALVRIREAAFASITKDVSVKTEDLRVMVELVDRHYDKMPNGPKRGYLLHLIIQAKKALMHS